MLAALWDRVLVVLLQTAIVVVAVAILSCLIVYHSARSLRSVLPF